MALVALVTNIRYASVDVEAGAGIPFTGVSNELQEGVLIDKLVFPRAIIMRLLLQRP